jgi:predicted DNA-binding transcriptional regulator YafY
MFKLHKIFDDLILENNKLINESVSDDAIRDAINNKYRVNITYDSGDGKTPGKRNIEVYALGDINGYPAIRAFQLFGDTKTETAVWKTFRVDKILTWQPTNFRFYNPVSDRDSSIPRYKEDGTDKTLGGSTDTHAQFNRK